MSTRKLLLADDSVTIQKVVNLTFADEGIEVISVNNGDSAIEKMAEIAPDLVMADVKMPGLNGYQVCERIKQDENFRKIPVILLVGSFEPFDEEEARRVGADDFLTKPFQSIRQLVSKVMVLLDANDRNAEQVYEATANNSFADTLEMNTSEISDSDQVNDLGDAGMDDEMIQASPVSTFALDESAKFETKNFASDEDPEDYKRTQRLSVYDLKEFSFVADSPEKASEPQGFQSFTESESDDLSNAEAQNSEEKVFEDNRESKRENFPSYFESSEDDLLEIPFDEDDEWETEEEEANSTDANQTSENSEQAGSESQFAGQYQSVTGEIPRPESFDETKSQATDENAKIKEPAEEISSAELNNNFQADYSENEVSTQNTEEVQTSYSQTESAETAEDYRGENEVVVGTLIEPENRENELAGAEKNAENQSVVNFEGQFSPELIEAVARRVVEVLSDQVVREIAWEVVPQHADLIIKKAVEEKLAGEKLTD